MGTTRIRLSLRATLASSVLIVGISALLLLTASLFVYHNLAYENEANSIRELVRFKTLDAVAELTESVTDLATALQSRKAFRAAYKEHAADELRAILDSQFRQYVVSNGSIKLEKLYVFDDALELVTASRQGIEVGDGSVICQSLRDIAKRRAGPDQLKPLNTLCRYHNQSFLSVMVPIGSFNADGYLQLIVDPAPRARSIERSLGTPVRVEYPGGEEAARSDSWPPASELDLYIIAKYTVLGDEDQPILSVYAARDIELFKQSLRRAGIIILSIACVVFIPSLVLALHTLRAGLRPIGMLQEAADQASKGVLTFVEETQYPDLNVPLRSFNLLARKAELAQALETEIKQHRNTERALQQALADAEASGAAKAAFMRALSEELRWPAAETMGLCEALLDADRPLTQRVDFIRRSIDSNRNLLHLAEEISLLGQFEANGLAAKSSSFDIMVVLEQVKQQLRAEAEKLAVKFSAEYEFPLPQQLHGDPALMTRIITVLAMRALSVTRKGTVLITARYDSIERQFQVEIRDMGDGLSAEQQKVLFEPFSPVSNSKLTSLSLHAAKRAAEYLGAGIAVASLAGVGTRITLSVPMEVDASTPFVQELPASVATPNVPATAPRVGLAGEVWLVCADDTQCQLCCVFLVQQGFQVTVLNDSLGWLDHPIKPEVKLIVLDSDALQDRSISVVRRLRESRFSGAVIALYRPMGEIKVQSLLTAGCDQVVAKPILRANLVDAIRQVDGGGGNALIASGAPIESQLLRRGNEFRPIVLEFCNNLPSHLRTLREFYDAGRWQQMRSQLTSLRIAASGMGYPMLADMFGKLAFEAAKEDPECAHRYLQALQVVSQRISAGAPTDSTVPSES